jgi:hypothetical protein
MAEIYVNIAATPINASRYNMANVRLFLVLVLAVASSRSRRNDDVGKTSGAELWAVDLFDSHPSFHRLEKLQL